MKGLQVQAFLFGKIYARRRLCYTLVMISATIKQKKVTPQQKAFIESATKKVLKDYGKTLKLLAKE